MRVVEADGRLQGTVQEIFYRADETERNLLCDKCTGPRHNQPIVGMTILWGLSKQSGTYGGGEILDPKNGKTYRCKIELVEGGSKLKVRGFIGISLLGRTQTWVREE